MNREKTKCHSYFAICGKTGISDKIGIFAEENSDFPPEYITEKLGIQPHKSWRKGDLHTNGGLKYKFSRWDACYQDAPVLSVKEQVVKIVNELKGKIPELLEIKQQYNVAFTISVVPHIYNEQTPSILINNEIVEFCYKTGTEIDVDLYVYDKVTD